MKELLYGVLELIEEAYAEAELQFESLEDERFHDVMNELENAARCVADAISVVP